ncbi:hypothetical protein AGDE_17136 [Angomonas deanei]|nr:hypothetical protein AGDE_17136 [Angomonas deanei]|eukprot:EPY15391.1 hypothetical protein AGDE_17136 [Angomonas deanei]
MRIRPGRQSISYPAVREQPQNESTSFASQYPNTSHHAYSARAPSAAPVPTETYFERIKTLALNTIRGIFPSEDGNTTTIPRQEEVRRTDWTSPPADRPVDVTLADSEREARGRPAPPPPPVRVDSRQESVYSQPRPAPEAAPKYYFIFNNHHPSAPQDSEVYRTSFNLQPRLSTVSRPVLRIGELKRVREDTLPKEYLLNAEKKTRADPARTNISNGMDVTAAHKTVAPLSTTFSPSAQPSKAPPAFGSEPKTDNAEKKAFVFGGTSAAPKPFGSGPPIDIPLEDGFAPNADADKKEEEKKESGTPFSFGNASQTAKAPTGFGFSGASAASKPFGSGPPIDIPLEDGFAPNADADTKETEKKATGTPFSFGNASQTAKAPPAFGFSGTNAAPKPGGFFGSGPSAGAPAKDDEGSNSDADVKEAEQKTTSTPFSFGNPSQTAAKAPPAFGSGPKTDNAEKKTFGFGGASAAPKPFGSGPPIDIPLEDGFAPNAEADKKETEKKATTTSFSFGGNNSQMAGNPFTFGGKPMTADASSTGGQKSSFGFGSSFTASTTKDDGSLGPSKRTRTE